MGRVRQPCRDGADTVYRFILDTGAKVICEGINEADAARKLPVRFIGVTWAVSEITGTRYDFI